MRNIENIDDDILSEFVDNRLDSASCAQILKIMESNASVRERVNEMRRAKELMKLAFADTTFVDTKTSEASTLAQPINKTRHWHIDSIGLVAASLLILITGVTIGGVGYHYSGWNQVSSAAAVPPMSQERVLLHISESDPAKFASVLSYVKDFLVLHEKSGRQVAVVANAGGLDLMRKGVSPYEQEVREIINRYPNVHFIACANSIRTLQKKGINPEIIDNIDTSLPAMDQIIKHVREGWSYIKIKSPTKI